MRRACSPPIAPPTLLALLLLTLLVALLALAPRALAHAGHAHVVHGPPAPDWIWGSSPDQQAARQRDSDQRGRARFAAELEQAPVERSGECVQTTEFTDVGEGCRTRDGLVRLVDASGGSILTHGPDYMESQLSTDSTRHEPHTVAAIRRASKDDIACVPDTERHTQVVYAIPPDGVDRSSDRVAPLRRAVYEVSAVIDAESRSLDSSAGRRLRVLCDGDGEASVRVMRLRTPAASASFSTVITDLHALSGTAPGTGTVRYLVFYDAHLGDYGGIGQLYADETASEHNTSNAGGRVALQDASSASTMPDWKTLLHEAAHTMGAVQDDAPDANRVGHCNDGRDVMCYEEASVAGWVGPYVADVCELQQFDCGHDTYFHPAPPAGSYLDTSWNVAATYNRYLQPRTEPVDDSPPGAPTGLVATGHGSFVRLAWDASGDGDGSGVAGYRVYLQQGADWLPVADSWPGHLTVDAAWDSITTNASYTLRVRAYDEVGNVGDPATVTVSSGTSSGVQRVVGGTMPAPQDVHVTQTTSTSLTVQWEPVEAGPHRYYRVEVEDGDGWYWWWETTATTRVMSGLDPATRYEIRVTARDDEGRISTETLLHGWTEGGPDAVAPAAPTGLAVVASDGTTPTLAWNAVGDAQSYAVGVFDGSWSTVATTTRLTRQVPGLDWDATHTVGVAARDEAGNVSGWSTITHTTPAAPDTTAPTNVPSLSTTRTTTTLTPTWGASTDDVGVVAYRVYVSLVDSSHVWLAAQTDGATRTATITGLLPGTTYSVRVQALDAAGNGSSTNLWWYLSTNPDSTAPTAPGSLAASQQTNTSMRLSWNASSDASGVASYRILRQDPGPAWTEVATTTGTTFDLTGLAPSTTYTFGVRAVDVAGNESTLAQVTGTTTGVADVVAPTTPTGLAASAITGSSMQLAWNASGDDVGVVGYRVRRTTPGPSGTLVATVAHPATSTNLAGLASQTDYSFTVSAYDAAGNESVAATVSASTLDVTAPTAPSALVAIERTTTTIMLGWNASSDSAGGPVSYRVLRLDGAWSELGTTSSTSFLASSLAPGTAYVLGVRAVDAAGNASSITQLATSTLAPPDTTAPTTPGTITVTGTTATSVSLSWVPSTDAVGVAGYRVYRLAPTASGSPVATSVGTSATITGLESGVSYTFAITAVDAAGNESAQRTVAAATPDVLAPSTPGAFTATALGETSIRLTWTASSDNVAVTGYRVLRVVAGVASELGTTTSLQYDVTGLQAATSHEFRVEAHDAAGNASMRPLAVATTPDLTAPTVPTSLVASERTDTRVRLAWVASSDAVGVAGYRVYRTSPSPDAAPIATSVATSVDVEALTAATTYEFAVSAVDAAGNESAATTLAVSTLDEPDALAPEPPTALAVTATSQTSGSIAWAAPGDVDVVRYRVERLDGATWTTVAEPTTTSWTLASLAAGTSYSLRVRAMDASGNVSTPSAAVVLQTVAAADVTAPTTPSGPVGSSGSPDGTMGLTWGASSDAGGVAYYRIWIATSAGWSAVATSTAPSTTISGLPAGWSRVGFTAVDVAGNESARLSTTVFVPTPVVRSLPGSPSAVWASATTRMITLSWEQPEQDGATGWTVRAYRGGVLVESRATSSRTATFGPFPAGTSVLFEVRTTNAAGEGPAASITASTHRDRVRPTRVARLLLRPRGRGRVLASWTPSRDASGIRRYELRLIAPRTRARIVRTRGARRVQMVPRLVRGRTYRVQVRAIDRAGNAGLWSRWMRVRVR